MTTRARTLHALAAAAALASVLLGLRQIRATSATYDEPVHLASGYAGWTTGTTLNRRDHPPLAELLAAAPLLALAPRPPDGPDTGPALYATADAFLYRNRVDADLMLSAARVLVLVVWSAAVCWPLVFWAAELSGAPAAAAAAALAACCPALVSNAALVTTDAAAAALFFLACFLLARPERRPRHWALAGACAGLALASKFSMIALPPLAALCLALERRGPARPRAAALLAALACAVAALWVGCGGHLGSWAEGLRLTMTRLHGGRSTFAAGRFSTRGFWWYFPLCVAAKTPLPLLALGALGAAAAAREARRWLWALLPAGLFFVAACASNTQIGLRHVALVYPPLILLAAAGVAALARRGRPASLAAAALVGAQAVGVSLAGPDLLTYFNAAAGGPERGYRLLVDSNYDWGQGLKALAAELRRRGDPPVALCYFGLADPAYYGIRYRPAAWINIVRRYGSLPPEAPEPTLFAVSATDLSGLYFLDRGLLRWLDPEKAVARPDPSIFLFDLSGDDEGRAHLAQLRR